MGLEYASVDRDKQELAADLDLQLSQFSAQAHASMAKVALAAAEFDELGGWCAPGIRSMAHWMAINVGFDPFSGGELLRVGHALKVLPKIAEAFAAGRLSFDKVRQVTSVATPATEDVLLEIACGASGSQLARICAALRRIVDVSHHEKQMEKRGLWARIEDDGMMRIVARLSAEDGAVVMAALESITANQPHDVEAEEPHAARLADSLVAMSNDVLAGGAPNLVKSSGARQVVVHVDVGVLTGEVPEGQCVIESGAPLSKEVARRIGCDCQIVAVTERDGLPIDVGRARRTIPAPLRRALEVRDRFCRFPGCGVPAHRAEGHHVDHWIDGGPTDRDNIVLLCAFHHGRHHDGGFQIVKSAGGGFRFETNDGHAIGERHLAAPPLRPMFALDHARATWGGARLDHDHLLWCVDYNVELAESRAGPN